MVAKYYVAIRPQTNEHHVVHKEGCPFLPLKNKRIFLGMFKYGPDAEIEGQKYFSRTDICPFCLKDHRHAERQPVFQEAGIQDYFPTERQISFFLNGSPFYILN